MSETNLPTVNFIAERSIITEGGEAQLLIFNLSEPSPPGGLAVKLNIGDPDGEGADTEFPPELISNIVDFGQVEEDGTITASLTIAEGETQAAFGISAINDNLVEGNETYSLTLLEDENYIADPNSTTINTTIEEAMTTTTVSLTPEILIATEGETFAWNFSLDQPAPSGGLSLFLPITVNNDPAPGDVEYNIDGSENISDFEFVTNNDLSVGFNLTIAEGATVATLVSEAVSDDVTESDESFTTVIADGVDYQANPEQNEVTTVVTELPVVSLVTESVTAEEGETFTWDLSLNQPAPEGGLTLFLPVTENSDPAAGDVEYNIDGSSGIADFEFVIEDDVSIGFNLTIAEGETEASLVSEVVTDDVVEGEENFTTVIADGENYRANPAQNSVVTNLSDADTSGNLPTVSLTPENVSVTEGETFSWNLSLDQPAPEGGLALSLPITFNNDPAPGDVEYNVDGSSGIADFEFVTEEGVSESFNITIAEGETEAVLVSQAISDDVVEGEEVFTTAIAEGDGYLIDSVQSEVTTAISDADTSTVPTVSLTPENVSVTEGETFSWNLSLDQPAPEGGLALSLPITFNNDPAPGDVEYNVDGSSGIAEFEFVTEEGVSESFNITIAEGETEAALVSQAISDDVEEGEEVFTTAIAEGDGYLIDPAQSEITTTISDADTSTDLPTVSLVAEPSQVNEGEQLEFNFNLTEPVGEGGLVINLDLVEDTDPLPGDISYFVEGSENVTDFELLINEDSGLIDGATITLAEGTTSATLLSDIIADNATEGEESVTFGLAESEEYSIDSEVNAASFTILDTSTDLNTSTSTSISFELDDLLVPTRDAVVDVTFDLDYVSGIDNSEFLEVGAIADSIENYLASNPADGDFFEVITEDLGEFLVSDSGLGIGEVAESITVELDVEPNSGIPFPFSVTSTVEIAEI